MEGVKGLLASKVFWGAAIIFLSSIVGVITHYQLTEIDQKALVDNVVEIVNAASAIWVVYGRVVATKQINRLVV
jgi:hypothetical protein